MTRLADLLLGRGVSYNMITTKLLRVVVTKMDNLTSSIVKAWRPITLSLFFFQPTRVAFEFSYSDVPHGLAFTSTMNLDETMPSHRTTQTQTKVEEGHVMMMMMMMMMMIPRERERERCDDATCERKSGRRFGVKGILTTNVASIGISMKGKYVAKCTHITETPKP